MSVQDLHDAVEVQSHVCPVISTSTEKDTLEIQHLTSLYLNIFLTAIAPDSKLVLGQIWLSFGFGHASGHAVVKNNSLQNNSH